MKNRSVFALTALLFIFGVPALFAETDKQFVQSDEVFITDDAFTDQDWVYAYLAKELKPATKESKQETQVQIYSDKKTKWTKNAFKTKIAVAKELKEGDVVIVLDARDSDGLYRGPANRTEALESYWFAARVTDLSDLFKDVVTVSGGYQVNAAALRVVVKP